MGNNSRNMLESFLVTRDNRVNLATRDNITNLATWPRARSEKVLAKIQIKQGVGKDLDSHKSGR